jgi:hypothetical protein
MGAIILIGVILQMHVSLRLGKVLNFTRQK